MGLERDQTSYANHCLWDISLEYVFMTWLAVQSLLLQAGRCICQQALLLSLRLSCVAQMRNVFLVSNVKVEWLRPSRLCQLETDVQATVLLKPVPYHISLPQS